jgi:cholesterol transport system auxiliary component
MSPMPRSPARPRTAPRSVAVLVALAALTLLPGCVSLGDKPVLTVYAPQVALPADDRLPRLDASLAIAEPNASTLLDSNRIAVRPEPNRLQVYAGAVWADAAPALVQAVLVDALGEGEPFRAVVRPSDNVGTEYLLRLDLRHFEVAFAGDRKAGVAHVELQATLVEKRRQRVLASRRFVAEAPAGRGRLSDAVPAFEAALTEVAGALRAWVLETAKAGSSGTSG